jgi:hypothetical protein
MLFSSLLQKIIIFNYINGDHRYSGADLLPSWSWCMSASMRQSQRPRGDGKDE